jgi:Fe-S cluster assembly iron-binding protein IscA
MAISLTEAAAKHVSRYMERRGKGIGLRLGVKTTGCGCWWIRAAWPTSTAPNSTSCGRA